ncbi:MAG: HlyC/CorC family transporter [Treponema sp.]|nr:HlyC/CorC family transporter [Treponema sp.]
MIVIAEIILIFFIAFFAASETAYTALSRITVRQMLKDNERNAAKVSKLKTNLDRLISTVLIGTNLVTTFASSIATAYAVQVFGPSAVSLTSAAMTILIVIFGEIIPKTYAGLKSKHVSQSSAVPILILQKLFFPVVWIFDRLSDCIEFVEKHVLKSKTPLITEEELKTLIAIGENEGTLEEGEKKLLDRLFEFSDIHVKDIMKHRSLVKYVNVHDDIDSVITMFNSGYSRLPVYEDSPDNIVGVLHYKSVLFANAAITQSKDFVKICMRQPMFVPESISAVELLQTFKHRKDNFAVAINEYGSMAGIVTMDDILKEVFGHITDEYGMTDIAPEQRISVVNTKEFLIPGDMKLDDFNDIMKMNLDSDSFDTIGGWLLEKFGELPSTGAAFKDSDAVYIVEDQSARRIQLIRLKLS